ncbi:MAG TPA: NYN domain-containing protein [Dehalococcoidia bacterium]|nr:NYN domain-containing protein [Dehalococcoidia bacterium]
MVPAPEPSPPPEAQAAPAPVKKTRRGTRGGRRRRKAEERETAAPAVPAAPEALPTLEALVARQAQLLETFAAEETRLLKGIQGSLSAIENRLAGAGPFFPPTQLPRVGIFVDVPNIMYAAERFGVNIDFGRLREMLSEHRELVRASAYAPISDDPQARVEQQRFVAPFVNKGYRIVTKPLKRFADGSMKANFDVELAIDVLTMSERLDVVCLVSGDGDFRRLVEMVASKGVRVEVVAFAASTSTELRNVADHYIDLTQYLEELRAR